MVLRRLRMPAKYSMTFSEFLNKVEELAVRGITFRPGFVAKASFMKKSGPEKMAPYAVVKPYCPSFRMGQSHIKKKKG